MKLVIKNTKNERYEMSKEKQQNKAEKNKADEALNDTVPETNTDEGKKNETDKEQTNNQSEELNAKIESLKGELEEKNKQCADYLDKLQRIAAEFDNYKKRSAKEKETVYIDAACDIVKAFLPVLDNVERALKAIPDDESTKSIRDGVEMILKQFKETFKNIGVEEITAVGQTFDPMLHNAVMHVEDDSYGHNTVVEEFQKGYMYKEKVIRYSMVKVAN
jgi:molecular chaperone GrpE